jgi:hypothetical protein
LKILEIRNWHRVARDWKKWIRILLGAEVHNRLYSEEMGWKKVKTADNTMVNQKVKAVCELIE